jgi:hypothetical protein
VHPGHVAHRGRDVPGHAEVNDHQRPFPPARHRRFDLGDSHYVVRRGGAAEDDVALAEGGGQVGGGDGAAVVVLGEGARRLLGTAEHGDRPGPGGGQVLGGNLGHAARAENEHPLSM